MTATEGPILQTESAKARTVPFYSRQAATYGEIDMKARPVDTRVRISPKAYSVLDDICNTSGLTKYEIVSNLVFQHAEAQDDLRHYRRAEMQMPILERLNELQHELEDMRKEIEVAAAVQLNRVEGNAKRLEVYPSSNQGWTDFLRKAAS